MLPIFVESYADLNKIKKVVEDLARVSPLVNEDNAPKTVVLNHIREAWNRVFVAGFAAEIEKTYTGMENVITKILRYTDSSVPTGNDGHKRLIDISALSIPGSRPPVCSEKTAMNLHKLRVFRHKIRHTYEIDLDLKIVREMVGTVNNAYFGLIEDIIKFHKCVEPTVSEQHLNQATENLVRSTRTR